MLDRVTPRGDMRDELVTIIRMLLGLSPAVKGDLPKPDTPAAPAAEPAKDTAKDAAKTAP